MRTLKKLAQQLPHLTSSTLGAAPAEIHSLEGRKARLAELERTSLGTCPAGCGESWKWPDEGGSVWLRINFKNIGQTLREHDTRWQRQLQPRSRGNKGGRCSCHIQELCASTEEEKTGWDVAEQGQRMPRAQLGHYLCKHSPPNLLKLSQCRRTKVMGLTWRDILAIPRRIH